jgi:hypothetical protein
MKPTIDVRRLNALVYQADSSVAKMGVSVSLIRYTAIRLYILHLQLVRLGAKH